jgi:fibronectin-binding autotransporter adhesin
MTLKKSHLLAALLCAGELTSRFAFAQDLVVDGGTTNITSGTNTYINTFVGETAPGNQLNVFNPGTLLTNVADLYVGDATSGNSLVISNGGSVAAATGIIGFTNTASNNSVLVTGTNSTGASSFIIGSDLFVGGAGSGNRMEISGGGTVLVARETVIGSDESSSNNMVTVSGPHSSWTNSDRFTVGDFGSSNRLVISSGGRVDVGSFFFIGFETNSSNNSILVTGADSILTNSINLFVGVFGSSNSLEISDGGEVALGGNAFIGEQADSSNNLVTVTDSGSRLTAESLYVGSSGSGNRLAVSNGGQLHVVVVPGFSIGLSAIGEQNGSSNNSIWVTGAGSRWTNEGFLYVGSSGSGNSLVISNGGQVSSLTNSGIGFALNSSNNRVLVTGTNANGDFSTWTNTGDLGVGVSGSGNTLEIFDGGRVFAANMGVGVESDATSNSVVVAGSDSVLTNSGVLSVGLGGSSNGLEISNGGRVEGIRGYIGYGTNSSNNTVLVTGTNSNGISTWTNSDDLYVGYDGSGNSLTIESGATVANTFGYIGYGTNSSNNFAVVTGAGSTWSNNGNFIVGHFGSSNRLIISNGGNVLGGDSYIGDQPGSSNNYVLVTDSNSTWTSADRLFVGHFGSSNSLVISNGATVANTGGVIGSATSSSNNSVLVTGTNANGDVSTWTNSGDLVVGEDGSSNSLVISNGGGVLNAVGYVGRNTNSSNNSVLVTGINSTWTNFSDLAIGSQGSSNTLVISNGATVANTDGVIGSATSSSNNSVLVTDGGTWTNSGNLFVGFDGSGNSLVISNGGSVVNILGYIGFTSTSSNNSVLVAGTNANGGVSTWTNSGNLFVGSSASGNSLVISNEGRVANVGGFIGNSTSSSNNSVLVTDGGTWTNSSSLYVGNFGSSNRLVISNGGTVSSFIGHIGNDSASSNNSVVVKGSNSFWTNSFRLYVGLSGSGNSLMISNEGTVANIEGYIGYYAVSSNNSVLVTSNSLWTNSGELGVGFEGSGNSLVISNGGRVANAVGIIGRYSMSSNNSVLVADGGTWTNSGDLYVGYDGSGNSLTIESGATVANTFGYIGYGTNSSNNFAVVTGSGSSLASGATIIVGREGSGNRVVVTNRGEVSAVGTQIGEQSNSTGNSVLVTGTNSRWANSGDFYVGNSGSGNSVVISNGGNVSVGASTIVGFAAASSNNALTVTGEDSSFSVTRGFSVGFNGSGNTLTVADGAELSTLISFVGEGADAAGNTATVTGSGSRWTNTLELYVGGAGNSNSLNITDGASVFADGRVVVSYESNSSANSMLISGSNSSLRSAELVLGWYGGDSSVTASNRASVNLGSISVGYEASSGGNSLAVTGVGTSWTNTSSVSIGVFGANNTLTISDGAAFAVLGPALTVGGAVSASNNSALVTGDGSSLTASNNLIVGGASAGNRLTIEAGGEVAVGGEMTVGFDNNDGENIVSVTGPDSSLVVGSVLRLGWFGRSNSLVISNAASVTVGASIVANEAGSTGNSVVVTDNSRWTNSGDLGVGYKGSTNSLVISNGGGVASVNGYIGFFDTASGNTVVVTGDGSAWSNLNSFSVGLSGSGNTLTISNGASVHNVDGQIGGAFGASDNRVTVTGTNASGSRSMWSNSGFVTIGSGGSSSSLTINDGAALLSSNAIIGNDASNNSVAVTGTGSEWANQDALWVGYFGSSNSVTVSQGGIVSVGGDTVLGTTVYSSNNSVLVADVGSRWTNTGTLTVGYSGSGNTLEISDGAMVQSRVGFIGFDENASDNNVTVTGADSTWTNSGFLFVGASGSGNGLVISDGANVANTGASIGNETSSTNNTVLVADATWTNAGNLVVGQNGSGNSLVISNGARVISAAGFLSYSNPSSNNTVTVTGAGSRWETVATSTNFADLFIGFSGSGNTLTISDQGGVYGQFGYVGYDASASNNSVLVTGTDSVWTNSLEINVGFAGSGNTLTVSNGGLVTAQSAYVGRGGDFNEAVVISNGRVAAGVIVVGDTGMSNSFSVLSGGQVEAQAGYVGADADATGNLALISGPGAVWSNTFTFYVGHSGSGNNLVVSNRGQLVVGGTGYVGYNMASSNSAVVTGAGSVWTNGGDLYIGYNGNRNSLLIEDGGAVYNVNGYDDGLDPLDNSNEVTVTGTGSRWVNSGNLTFGLAGHGNRLNVYSNGLVTVGTNAILGDLATASNNTVIIADTGSRLEVGETIFVGKEGGGNLLFLQNGGAVTASSTIIGSSASSVSNRIGIAGTGSSLTNTGDLYVGHGGSANSLGMVSGGVASANVAYVGYSNTSAGNSVGVAGPGAVWSNTSVFLGYHGDSNSLNVSGGGRVVTTGSSSVGYAASSSNNRVVIDGSMGLAVWESQGDLFLGIDGQGNTLTIANGGNLFARSTTVGASDGNLATVRGSGSIWSNTATLLLGMNAGNNSVEVTDGASLTAGSVGIGLGGSSNRMTVSSGGLVQVTNTTIIGLDTNSSNGSVLVTGDGTVWSNAGQFILGMEGVGHSLTVSDGATLSATDINIAPFAGSEGTLNIGEFGGSNAAGIIDVALIGFGVGTGSVNFNQTNTFVLSNTVTGAGSLNQLGSGTLLLGGDLSTFTGTVSVAVGTIMISNLTDLGGTTNLFLASGGTFDVAQGGTNTISLDLSVTNGTGTIVNSGGGTLVLDGNLSKSGSVLVLAGGEFVVNGVITGSGAPGSFNSDIVFSNAIVTLDTTNDYAGPTFVQAGSTLSNGIANALPTDTILNLGAQSDGAVTNTFDMAGFDQTIGGLASVGPASNVVVGNGTLTVSGPSSTVFNGTLQGNINVVRAGTGATTLGGANTYSGGTTIRSGRLVAANASALGSGDVQLLGGTLELQSLLDIASLFWDGAATIALPGAAAGQFLKVTGLLELTNGVNNFNLAGAALPRSPVKLLTSTNLPTLSTNDFGVLGLGSYTLSIEGDSLYLTAQDISYQSFAITPNQVNVATALDTFIGASGDRGTVSAALDTLAISQYPAAFEQMMPSQYASLPSMAFNTANALNSSLFQRMWAVRVNGGGFSSSGLDLAPMPAEMGGTDDMGVFAINPSKETRWGTFVDGNGVFANAASTGSVQNYRSQSGGVMVGASYRWNGNLSTGVYAGYQGLQAEYDSGRTIDNAVRFGVFGTYDIEDFYFNALVGGAYHGYTVNRYINFGGIDRTATGRPGAGEFDLALGTGYDFKAGDLVFGPFTTLQYTYLGVQGFTETGADSLNLDVSPYNSSSLLYTLGGQAAYNWRASSRVTVTPSIFAGWQHEFLQNGYAINSSFNTGGPAAPFAYDTSAPARDYFYGGAGVTVGVGERWTASFIYSAFAANADVSSQNLYFSIGVEF